MSQKIRSSCVDMQGGRGIHPMMGMYRFRLESSMFGVYRTGVGLGSAELIPEGAEVCTSDPNAVDPSAEGLKMIMVEWEGKSRGLFLADLRLRSKRL
jgi:hypothetical protein